MDYLENVLILDNLSRNCGDFDFCHCSSPRLAGSLYSQIHVNDENPDFPDISVLGSGHMCLLFGDTHLL